jgi:hypothetical protein
MTHLAKSLIVAIAIVAGVAWLEHDRARLAEAKRAAMSNENDRLRKYIGCLKKDIDDLHEDFERASRTIDSMRFERNK